MKEAALAYALRLGWRGFPVAGDCRSPIKGTGFEHGCHTATNDPAEIERRWSLHPTANIALATGTGSGVFVLDVDVKALDGRTTLAVLEDENGWLPETWTARTPSGGQHIYFRQPVNRALRNRVGFAPGLDVRTDGGSVALPPSRRPDGLYMWTTPPSACPVAEAPEWLLELIDPPEPARTPRPPLPVQSVDRTTRYVERALDGECAAVMSMAAHTGRNVRLFQAAANLGELCGAGLLPEQIAESALEDAAAACGLIRDDGLHSVRASIRSGLRRGQANPREVSFDRRAS